MKAIVHRRSIAPHETIQRFALPVEDLTFGPWGQSVFVYLEDGTKLLIPLHQILAIEYEGKHTLT